VADYDFAYSDGDVDTNRSDNPGIHQLLEARYSRRSLIGGLAAGAAALPLAACGEGGAPGTSNTGNLQITTAGQTTSGGKVVTLAASTSGVAPASVSWSQISGPPVTLANPNALTTSFLAPAVVTPTPLVFQLSVVDSQFGNNQAVTNTVTVDPAKLGFNAVAKSLADVVTVPAGYSVSVLYRLGDPINAATAAYANNGTDSDFASRAGDHHDGLYYYGLAATGNAPDPSNNTRGILCINHENITASYLHPSGPTTTGGVRPVAEATKEIECHGVSVIEVTRAGSGGAWSYVQGSALNRRITPFTPVEISGPLRGHPTMKTLYSAAGTQGRGTINNCANGFTPWGTYLTCEENWVGYFRRDASDLPLRSAKEQTSLARNGRGGAAGGNNNWTNATPVTAGDTRFAKFNITIDPTKPADGTGDFRNEINQFGWVVEIDPYNPAAVPKKRTALARFAHEGAWPGGFIAGRKPAWYMGDDAGGDYLYKFVSAQAWVAADAAAADRMATGDKYLDAGTVYVARFNADGTGTWLPLTFGTGNLTAANAAYAFADQGDVLLNARLAGDAVGATRMDRPEWTAVNPRTGEVYLTLTNGPTRNGTTLPVDAANPRVYVDAPSTTRNNRNGHIIRLRETGDTTEATTFTWDIYVFAAGSDLDAVNINVSALDATNDMSSPDGLWFSRPQNAGGIAANPLLWVQTDDGAFTDVTNCMMLVGQPGIVGDGTTKTITSTTAAGATVTATTKVGALPGTNLRRFLVGPKECEITGVDSTPDGRTVFVNIQHPGENGNGTNITSTWPAGTAGSRPRSATIVITKDDGGVVGV
jgi:uncharacterized protein